MNCPYILPHDAHTYTDLTGDTPTTQHCPGIAEEPAGFDQIAETLAYIGRIRDVVDRQADQHRTERKRWARQVNELGQQLIQANERIAKLETRVIHLEQDDEDEEPADPIHPNLLDAYRDGRRDGYILVRNILHTMRGNADRVDDALRGLIGEPS